MPGIAHPPYIQCKAVWDTGAMSSVITPTLARKLGLFSLGLVKMHHANGDSMVNTYMINLLLPNKMEVSTLYVMEGDMTDNDILIGMDVITLCDFAIYVDILFEGYFCQESYVSFPDFTRHFFSSLTETLDSFAKCILNNKTHAAKASCFC